jgi:thymidylate synthase
MADLEKNVLTGFYGGNHYIFDSYDKGLQYILENGVWKSNKRTGVKTLAVCGVQTRYSLTKLFPVMTRRKYFPKSVFAELLWFISGSTNNNDLVKLGCNFWTPWVSKEFEQKHGFVPGSFGPVYGFQLRYFNGNYGDGSKPQGGFDQLAWLMQKIQEDPSDRRLLFSLWNPQQMHMQRLPPCHILFQVMIDDNGYMSGHLTQRSNDYPVGVPANIQFYSALTCMIAQQTGYKPLEFVHEAIDSHIYENQIDAVRKYLETPILPSPTLELKKAANMYSYKLEDFVLEGFKSGEKIEIPVAV